MGMLNSIWYGKEEPPRNNVLWAKPVKGGFAFYVFDGKWKPQKVMDDNSSAVTDDDEVLPLEYVEVNNPYTDIYIGVGDSVEDILLPSNLHKSIQRGDTVDFTDAQGTLYIAGVSSRIPKLLMSNYPIPSSESTVTIGDVEYYVSASINTYNGSFKVEVI